MYGSICPSWSCDTDTHAAVTIPLWSITDHHCSLFFLSLWLCRIPSHSVSGRLQYFCSNIIEIYLPLSQNVKKTWHWNSSFGGLYYNYYDSENPTTNLRDDHIGFSVVYPPLSLTLLPALPPTLSLSILSSLVSFSLSPSRSHTITLSLRLSVRVCSL